MAENEFSGKFDILRVVVINMVVVGWYHMLFVDDLVSKLDTEII